MLKQKQEERATEQSRLKSLYKLDSKYETIANYDWNTLVQKLQTRELKAVEVLHAYIAKAVEANEKCNCITDFIPQAHVSLIDHTLESSTQFMLCVHLLL